MKYRNIALPLLGAVAGTRALLGAGAGLLLAPRMRDRKRRRLGKALLTVGIASTVPLATLILGRH